MMLYRYGLLGKPVVQQRPRKGSYGNFYDPSKEEKKRLGWQLLAQRSTSGYPLLREEIGLKVVFYGLERGDLDNAIKALCDAGNGILWKDDKQILKIEANATRKSENPRTEFMIKEITYNKRRHR